MDPDNERRGDLLYFFLGQRKRRRAQKVKREAGGEATQKKGLKKRGDRVNFRVEGNDLQRAELQSVYLRSQKGIKGQK